MPTRASVLRMKTDEYQADKRSPSVRRIVFTAHAPQPPAIVLTVQKGLMVLSVLVQRVLTVRKVLVRRVLVRRVLVRKVLVLKVLVLKVRRA
jgi:hypothetical protein